MRLTLQNDTLIACADCGRPARATEIEAAHGASGCRVAYQTHALSLHDAEHGAVFARIAAFYERAFTLLDELNVMEKPSLTYGRIVSFDIEPIMPSACAHRTHIIAVAAVRVAGLIDEARSEMLPLDGATVDSLIDILLPLAQAKAAALSARFEARDF